MSNLIRRALFGSLVAVSMTLVTAHADTVKEISGAGATFPYPVYAKWAEQYNKDQGVKMNYQSIGSGGGIKQIQAKTVDFGASDAPLEPAELKASGLMQFPMVMGGVVPVINVPGIEQGKLRLTATTLADIYLGKITTWNDSRIAADNKDIKLPATRITVVHRADGSGTTWIFTNYLAKVSPEWKTKVGNDKSVSWPAGVGGKGNEGVASYVNRIKGSIGYVEYAYALQNKMNSIQLQNHDGKFVAPTSETFQAAAAGADWAHSDRFYMVLTDQPGAKSWPITGATFILVYNVQDKPDSGRAVLNFFDWAYRKGGKMAEELDYVPMPDNVIKLVEKTWASNIKDTKGKAVWTGAVK